MGFDDLCSTIDFFNFLHVTPAHPHAQSLFLFPIVFGINQSEKFLDLGTLRDGGADA